MNRCRVAAAAAVLGCCVLGIGPAGAQHGAAGHVMVTPAELRWAGIPSLPPGAEIAVIEGPMSQAAPFTARLRFPANYRIPPHTHTAIEHVTVLSGTFNMGAGTGFDRLGTMALSAGSMAIMQAGTPHFAWTGEETVVQLHGVGPWNVEYVDAKDDPRRQ